MKNKVSVIVPVYNGENDIEKCLKSILDQDYSNIEVIVVDDGSQDNTRQVVEKIKCSSIKLIKNPSKGVSSARNYGIDNSTGEYIVFIDADDMISPCFVSTLVGLLDDGKYDCGSVAYSNNFDAIVDCINSSKTIMYSNEDKYLILTGIYTGADGFVWNKIYKSKIVKNRNVRFNENVSSGEDLLFNNSYFKESNALVHCDAALYYYQLNCNSSINRLSNPKWFDLVDVYLDLLKSEIPDASKRLFEFNFAEVVLEAIYRLNYCEESKYSINQLKQFKKNYVHWSSRYTIKQNVKLLLFMLLPHVSMIYKRRMLKED